MLNSLLHCIDSNLKTADNNFKKSNQLNWNLKSCDKIPKSKNNRMI